MYTETATQLAGHLEHPNGWWRDTAQKLLILRQDKSVVPALEEMARTDQNELARIHALWTLDGLEALKPGLVREVLRDGSPRIRATGIRLSESLELKDDASLKEEVKLLAKDPDPNVVIQAMLTANLLKWPESKEFIGGAIEANRALGVREIGYSLLNTGTQVAQRDFTAGQLKQLRQVGDIYNTLCATCHGVDATGIPMVGAERDAKLAPALAGSRTINGPEEGSIGVLLHGLTGAIDGKNFGGTMVSMSDNADLWIAAVLSYIRNSFGNHGGFVSPEDVAKLRAAMRNRSRPWTMAELLNYVPSRLSDRRHWKLTASQNADTCPAAIDGNQETGYCTGAPQTPGQWVQIELPKITPLSGLTLDCSRSPGDYPREYSVEISRDGHSWESVISAGKGDGAITDIRFPPAQARFLRLTQTGKAPDVTWSIYELQLFSPAMKPVL